MALSLVQLISIKILFLMKSIKLLVAAVIICLATPTQSQTAEEIIDTYLENIGGYANWEKVESMRVIGVGRQGGVDYPFVATMMKDGRSIVDVDMQGTSYIFEAFDGETGWSSNFQTMQAEAFDSERSNNFKAEAKDQIPDAFFNYKEKGYSVELLGNEQFEGSEAFKIKLTKKPVLVDGNEEENIDIYYFDTENFVPIAYESVILSGEAKGLTVQYSMTDYQEVDGRYVPFTNIQKVNGNVVLEMIYNKVEFNIDVDESIFVMPKE